MFGSLFTKARLVLAARCSRTTLTLIAAAAVIGACLGREWLLERCAVPLVVRETPAGADCLWLRSEWGLARAVELHRENPQRIFLAPKGRWNRLTACGAVPAYGDLVRETLIGRFGMPAAAVQVVAGTQESDWDEVLSLGRWLQAHPQSRMLFLADGFEGGAWREMVRRALPAELAARVAFESVCLPGCTEKDWWKSRLGAKSFCAGWLYFLYAWRYAQLPPAVRRWDAAAYRRWLGALPLESPP